MFLLYSQLLSHEFNPLIKYSQAGVTSVILRVVVEEDIEGEEFGGFCFWSSQSGPGKEKKSEAGPCTWSLLWVQSPYSANLEVGGLITAFSPSCKKNGKNLFWLSNQLLKVTTTGGWLLWRGPSLHLNTSRRFNFFAQPAFAKAAFTFCSRTMLMKSSSSSPISSSIQSLSIPCTNRVLCFLAKETKWKEWFTNCTSQINQSKTWKLNPPVLLHVWVTAVLLVFSLRPIAVEEIWFWMTTVRVEVALLLQAPSLLIFAKGIKLGWSLVESCTCFIPTLFRLDKESWKS